MDRPFKVVGVFGIYWNHVERPVVTVATHVPRATIIVDAWIHASSSLKKSELVHLKLSFIFFSLLDWK
jgi:hypothetical protein